VPLPDAGGGPSLPATLSPRSLAPAAQ